MKKRLSGGWGIVVGVIAFALPALAAKRDQSEDAVAYQLNPAHTGSVSFTNGFAPPLVKAWTVNIATSVTSYPLIAAGRVFLTTNTGALAIDLSTGKTKWSVELPCCGGQVGGAYDNGKLFYQFDSGLITALNAKTGKLLWSVQLPDETYFPAPPVAANGQVFTTGQGQGGIVYSVKERTGKLQWTQPIFGAGFPSLGDGALFLTSQCDNYRLNPADGETVWLDDTCVGGSAASAAYANQRLFVTSSSVGAILDAEHGGVVGTFPDQNTQPVMFTTADGKRLGLTDVENQLECWNMKTGEVVWSFFHDLANDLPVVVNGVIYFGTDNTLYALDAKRGKRIWSDDSEVFSLTAGDGKLIALGSTGLIAYEQQ